MQAGLYAARRIRRELAGQPPGKAFRDRDLGSAAYVSRGNAVVSVGRLHLDGFLGWWAWLVIHIGFMTGFRTGSGPWRPGGSRSPGTCAASAPSPAGTSGSCATSTARTWPP